MGSRLIIVTIVFWYARNFWHLSHHTHNRRSSVRYWIASEMCANQLRGLPSRSAIVREIITRPSPASLDQQAR